MLDIAITSLESHIDFCKETRSRGFLLGMAEAENILELLKETKRRMTRMENCAEERADIMNAINDALEDTDYVAVGYDNTGTFLTVILDKK